MIDATINTSSSFSMRYETIDIARGVAIVLVVIGHYWGEGDMPCFFEVAKDVIYMFHMPLFIFVSGFLAVATWKAGTDYTGFETKKFRRLMIPYAVASVIILLIKLGMQSFMAVDHPVGVSDFRAIMWSPAAGSFLWFLWALWWMMVVFPFFNSPRKRLVLLAISILTTCIYPQITEIMCLSQTARYLIFFVAGGIACDVMRSRNIREISVAPQIGVCLGFVALAFISYNYMPNDWMSSHLIELLTAFAGTGTTLATSHWFTKKGCTRCKAAVMSISGSSFVIYLFHTTAEGFAKSGLAKIGFFSGGDIELRYSVAAFVVVIIGVVVPWWLDRYVIRRYSITRQLFGYPKAH